MKQKNISNMSDEEAAIYALEIADHARKRAERSDKFQTFVLMFCTMCSILRIVIRIIVTCQ